MYKLRKTFTFDAAHSLPYHLGKCKHLHGHTYIVTIEVIAPGLVREGNETGMVCDLGFIKELAQPIIDSLDHKFLNDVAVSDLLNPT